MKAALFTGGEPAIAVREVPEPAIGPGEALIRVGYAGICGTDLTICDGGLKRVRPPVILGHEFSGEIEEIRDGLVPGLSRGDPVVVEPLLPCGACYACRAGFPHVCSRLALVGIDADGAFAPYVKVPAEKVYRIPAALPLDRAAIVEPLAVAVHVVRRSNLKAGDKALVLGAGPVGMLVAQVVRTAGASQVIVSEVSGYRLDLARKLGFVTIDASHPHWTRTVEELTRGEGADVVFEVTGSPSVSPHLVSLARIRGQIVMVGVFKESPAIDMQGVSFKELSLIGSRVYEAFDFARAIDLLTQGRVDVQPLISHVLPLDEAAHGFQIARQAREAMKVLFQPR